jgi:1-acyl-sn-glycerol-3-phosphate acyltransferase
MAVVRSLLFMLILLVVTPPYTLLVILCRPLPHHVRRRSVVPWVNFTIWLVKHVLGIPYQLLGAENIPAHAVIVLAKHQSAWETLMLQEVFKDTVFVWRKEIKYLPFFGWALASIPMIETDRSVSKATLTRLVDQGRDRLENGYTVVIFPEGTRAQPGSKSRYKVGGAHLAAETGTPVVPVALNSGEFWGRGALITRSGVVTVSIGPAIDPAGLSAGEITQRAEAWIEAEMIRISPQLYGASQ